MYKRVITLIVCVAFLAGCATLDFKKRNEECNELLDESTLLLIETKAHMDSLEAVIDSLKAELREGEVDDNN